MNDLVTATADWSPDERKALLDYWASEAERERVKARYADPSELAQAVDPRYVITPALKLIAGHIETALRQPRCNLMITVAPQEGKSLLCSVFTPLRAWQLDPHCRVILATYADNLAVEHSLRCRELIASHGAGVIDQVTGTVMEDKLGYSLAVGQNRMNAWKLAGSRGGMIAVGLGASITGRRADLMIIDDPIKNQMEADSANHRRKVMDWYNSVAQTRLSPTASTVLIMTRWHPEDLAGQIIADQVDADPKWKTWKLINIPAVAEEGIPDALGREPGEVMVSARGRTADDFERIRRSVGERVWYAMYQGSPRNPAGGLFARAWFDPPADEPENPVATVVAIDPADTGEGDDTGIVAASLSNVGEVVYTEDWSGKFTADEWSRRAVLLALTVGAREIAMEAYSTATTYEAVLRRAYRALHTDAVAKRRTGADLTAVESRALTEQPPFTIHKWRAGARVDAVGRSALLRQALETKRARVVEYKMAQLVEDAADWQSGQHCPDRVAAAVIAHDRLAALAGAQMAVVAPASASLNAANRRTPPNASSTGWSRRLGR